MSSFATSVTDEFETVYSVNSCLGEGGQGAVYLLNQGTGNGLVAKVLKDPMKENGIMEDEKRYKAYKRKIRQVMAMPSIPHVAKPIAMLKSPQCGYIMRMMGDMESFTGCLRPLKGETVKSSLAADGGLMRRYKLLGNLARILEALHTNGIVYCDLSPGNVYVSKAKKDAEVWLIDLDNLTYGNEVTASIGTPSYRAPEITKGGRNTIAADNYSYALIAYECLTFGKPFCGVVMDEEEDEDFGDSVYDRIERGEIDYIYEENTKNKPKQGTVPLEIVATEELCKLFFRTFSKSGRENPETRPRMWEWVRAFELACDELTNCECHHWHLGETCFICGNKEQNRYRIQISEVYYTQEAEGLSEDGEDPNVSRRTVLIREKRWAWSNLKDCCPARIPWSSLERIRHSYDHDRIAFEISVGRGKCSIERLYDPKLSIRILNPGKGDDPAGMHFTATYDHRIEYEFLVKKEA